MPGIADQLIADYANAWNVHDADALAFLFHEDGTFVNVVGDLRDRAAGRVLEVHRGAQYPDRVGEVSVSAGELPVPDRSVYTP
jgi:hypothetical protein